MITSNSPERRDASPGASWATLEPSGATLSPHDTAYLEARAVTVEVARAAGLRTARKPAGIPPAFSPHQRRRTPTLIAPHLSPDRVSVGWQKRDLHPGRNKSGEPIKWMSPKGARIVLSVHPWTANEVRHGAGRLWLPEGLTRLLALTSRDEVAASYAGAHAWKQHGEPLRCFDYVNLSGRLVLDVPDADYRTNEQVQKALGERVRFLESRGARVLVVSVPAVSGDPTAGLDDYLAAGGDLEALVRNAAPFVPVDVGRERLKKDERLRLAVAKIRRNLESLETRKARECSAEALARYLVGEAERHGKTAARGVKVRPSRRQMASGIRVALATVGKALDHLESVGFLEPLPDNRRAPHEAASNLLLYPSRGGSELSEHIGRRGAGGEEGTEVGGEGESSLSQREPFLSVHLTRGGLKSATDREKVPALRNSKLVHEYARKDGRRVVVDSRYYPRYGKKCEAIIRYVLEAGGVHERELHEEFGSPTSRLRDFRRTWLDKKMIKDGVLVRDGGWILPAPDWPEALERVRERTDEEADNRRQDERYAEQGRNFRERLAGEKRGTVAKPERVPELAGPERTAEIVEAAERRDQAARVEEQRLKVGTTPETFLADALEGNSGFGWRELGALWKAKGGKTEDLRRAVKHPYRFNREGGSGALYVERRDAAPEQAREPAPVAVLREPENLTKPDISSAAPIPQNLKKPETEGPPAEDWRSHPLDCECPDCAVPMPTYARAWSGA